MEGYPAYKMRAKRGGLRAPKPDETAYVSLTPGARLLSSKHRFLHECDLIDILIYLAIKIGSNSVFFDI